MKTVPMKAEGFNVIILCLKNTSRFPFLFALIWYETASDHLLVACWNLYISELERILKHGQNDGKWLHQWVWGGRDAVDEKVCASVTHTHSSIAHASEKANEVLKLCDFFVRLKSTMHQCYGLVCALFECFMLPFAVSYFMSFGYATSIYPWWGKTWLVGWLNYDEIISNQLCAAGQPILWTE